MGYAGDAGLERGTLEVAGVRRSYWLARSPGPQYLPVRALGPIPRQLGATGILLDMVTAGAARA